MTLTSVLEGLDVAQRHAVTLVYFEGRTVASAARLSAVEPAVLAASLAAAFRCIARALPDLGDERATAGTEPAVPVGPSS